MKFPLSWLRDWIELPEDLQQITDLLIKVGVGLDAVENPGIHMTNVVVARVLKRDAHPNADKLSLCTISDGTQNLQIVCGAKNFKEGDLVPLAHEGALLPGNFKIKRSKIRGVESFGMLCSTDELGLGKGEDGLFILNPSLKEGTPLADALGLNDPILDVETTANRPDHLSIRGLAREIGALTGKPLKQRAIKFSEGGASVDTAMKVAIEDAQACPRYMAKILRGVKIGPSPEWMKRRLHGAGIRSINNVVDATNYVLIEYGQPLHAFDLLKLEGGAIKARLAHPGEMIQTLDGEDRRLEASDLVIADAKKPVAVAGVMGGANSEVTEATTELLLEAAIFRPIQVRRSSRRLGLRSESSLRFERGIDGASTEEALNRATGLIQELAGGLAAPGSLSAGTEKTTHSEIQASAQRINALLGSNHSVEEMTALLQRRGFKAQGNGDRLDVTAPSWRQDVIFEADLAEEVAHLAGLDKVVSTNLPEVRAPDVDADEWTSSWMLRHHLAACGLHEALTLTYLDPVLARHWGLQDTVKIDNPLSEELSLLRPSLLPNLLSCALESMKHKAPAMALYELGRVFSPGKENAHLAVVLCGQRHEGGWTSKATGYDFYDLRGILESLAHKFSYALRIKASTATPSWLHPGQSAQVNLGPMSGWMGALHPALAKVLDARQDGFVIELEGWAKEPLGRPHRFQNFSLLPQVERDLSCLVSSDFEAGQLLEAIKREGFSGPQLRLKDVFEGPPLAQGKKSLTVSLIYLAGEQTLTDDEVNKRHADLCEKLKAAMPLEIRD